MNRLPTPSLQDKGRFGADLYANLYAFDVQDLGFRFRLLSWGRASDKQALCGFVRMGYATLPYENPDKAIVVELNDLSKADTRVRPELSDLGRQEMLLLTHQHLYSSSYAERWFHHLDTQTLSLEALPKTTVVLDAWISPMRSYWIARAFLGGVRLDIVLSGFDEEEVGATLKRLVPIADNDRLAEWHDKERLANEWGFTLSD